MASGNTQWVGGGAGAFAAFLANGIEITDVNQLAKGDIIQKYASDTDLHTTIILSRVSGSTFNVVDSNSQYDEIVRTHTYTVTLSGTMRAFRLGQLSVDTDRDGIQDTSDSCPTTAGALPNGCPVSNTASNLVTSEVLRQDQGIYSANRSFLLYMQADGNLVLYRNWPWGGAAWSSNTSGIGAGAWAVMQTDGNFVVYDSSNRARFATNTGVPGSYLILQDDGNLVIYSATGVRWASGSTSTPPARPSTTAWYEFKNANSGLCVDARSGGTGNGTAIQQYSCNRTDSQKFKFVDVGGGFFQVLRRNANSQSLDVTGASTADGAKIQTWSYVGGSNQQWYPERLASGYWRLRPRHSAKCLDVPGASRTSGVQLQQYSCNGTTAQSFLLTVVG